jgi:hypothetical protein
MMTGKANQKPLRNVFNSSAAVEPCDPGRGNVPARHFRIGGAVNGSNPMRYKRLAGIGGLHRSTRRTTNQGSGSKRQVLLYFLAFLRALRALRGQSAWPGKDLLDLLRGPHVAPFIAPRLVKAEKELVATNKTDRHGRAERRLPAGEIASFD